MKFKKYHSEQYITFQRRDEKFVLDQLLEDLRIGFILECFGKNIEDKQITIKEFLEQNTREDLEGKCIKFRNPRNTYTNYLKIRRTKITQQKPNIIYIFSELYFSISDDDSDKVPCYYRHDIPEWFEKDWILEQAIIITEEEFNEARFGNKKSEFENTGLSLRKLRKNIKKNKNPIKYISTDGNIYYLYVVDFKTDQNYFNGESFRVEAIEGFSIVRGRFCGPLSKDSDFLRVNQKIPCTKTIENPFKLYFKEPEDFLNNAQFISKEEFQASLLSYLY